MFNELFVIAGGFGTRIRTVESKLPKPLININGNPFLFIVFKIWYNSGIRRFCFLLHYDAKKIIKSLNNLQNIYKDCEIRYVVEEEPLGTGGSVINGILQFKVSENILITNCDTWIEKLPLKYSMNDKNYICVKKIINPSRFGTVVIDNMKITGFFEKKDNLNKISNHINIGLYNIDSKLLHEFGDGKQNVSLENDILPILVKNNVFHAVEYTGSFFDIGIPKDYFSFTKFIENYR